MDLCDGRAKIERILPLLAAEIGEPKQDVSGDPLDELIGTILSQNTSDTNSHRAHRALRERYPTWRAVRDAAYEELVETIRSGGLAAQKATTIQSVLRELPTVDGEPTLDALNGLDEDAAIARLTSFRGVGIKTAACVLLFALGRDVCPVDTHIHRVMNRLGIVETKSPDKTHVALNPLIPEGEAYRFHVLTVRFGRRICKAPNPRCDICPLFDECGFEGRHDVAAKANARKGHPR